MTETQLKKLIKVCTKSLNESLLSLTREQLRKIIHLGTIHGVSTLDKLQIAKKHRLEVYKFVFRRTRWLLTFEYPNTEDSQWRSPFTHFFQSEGESNEDWLSDFHQALVEELNNFKHWVNSDPPLEPSPWAIKYKIIQDIAKKYPTFERDLTNLIEYVQTLFSKTATSPLNPENYPLFVSLYIVSREYGGPEEGGWYFPFLDHKASLKINNFKEARVGAIKLLREMEWSRVESASILLEKIEGSLQTRERPHYS